jgi:hypothetical protein
VIHLAHDPVARCPESRTLDGVLWYFAYGSNLDPAVFEGRRRMHPTDACAARLDGWRLVFDLPVGPGERAVANVRADPLADVHGAAYRITRNEARHLDRTEGVHLKGGYRRRTVEVVVDTGERLAAFTYQSRSSVQPKVISRHPSGMCRSSNSGDTRIMAMTPIQMHATVMIRNCSTSVKTTLNMPPFTT